jgi:hypothetical protein
LKKFDRTPFYVTAAVMKKTMKRKQVRARPKVWLIGLRLDSDNPEPSFYTFLVGDDQKPLLVKEQIVLANQPQLPREANLSTDPVDSEPWEPDLICDLAEALYLIENGDCDDSAAILNCLNVLFDLVAATRGTLPQVYKKNLTNLADHLTFHKSLTAFFQEAKDRRSAMLDSVLWCIGWIMTHARIINSGEVVSR